uniref:Uncharacterized protein n=1 Tax=Chromera velia CCMP2878 TaxID=1169474 RepID=A0A0G4IFC1_9ALVE|eukprot:Cvel_13843.t1-p1 / transcript=Cvel_13843.t1 / gene=Cvel_13843 / organism=Chromera_velia_CCMP2878 / gene_product=hypothetical protein / transcript_product=hypothetical protein / location=Cvel_scaffold961:50994-53970(+) / protein_length=365 / sequence_SO=supercontig / SO=protein_coding / is_pseudo=false
MTSAVRPPPVLSTSGTLFRLLLLLSIGLAVCGVRGADPTPNSHDVALPPPPWVEKREGLEVNFPSDGRERAALGRERVLVEDSGGLLQGGGLAPDSPEEGGAKEETAKEGDGLTETAEGDTPSPDDTKTTHTPDVTPPLSGDVPPVGDGETAAGAVPVSPQVEPEAVEGGQGGPSEGTTGATDVPEGTAGVIGPSTTAGPPVEVTGVTLRDSDESTAEVSDGTTGAAADRDAVVDTNPGAGAESGGASVSVPVSPSSGSAPDVLPSAETAVPETGKGSGSPPSPPSPEAAEDATSETTEPEEEEEEEEQDSGEGGGVTIHANWWSEWALFEAVSLGVVVLSGVSMHRQKHKRTTARYQRLRDLVG